MRAKFKPEADSSLMVWWKAGENHSKLPPWHGLTPEEAYRKGQKDEHDAELERQIEKLPKK